MELLKNSYKDKVQHCIINQKSMTVEQLYGQLDTKTGEWSDGRQTSLNIAYLPTQAKTEFSAFSSISNKFYRHTVESLPRICWKYNLIIKMDHIRWTCTSSLDRQIIHSFRRE